MATKSTGLSEIVKPLHKMSKEELKTELSDYRKMSEGGVWFEKPYADKLQDKAEKFESALKTIYEKEKLIDRCLDAFIIMVTKDKNK